MMVWKQGVAVVIAGVSLVAAPITGWGQEGGEAGAGIRIRVIDGGSGAGVEDFQVLAGVPYRGEGPAAGEAEVVSWQPHTIRAGKEGTLFWPLERGYADMALRVEAQGYVPARQTGIVRGKEPAELVFKLVKDAGIDARVLQPDGTPAAGAMLAVTLPQRAATVKGGRLQERVATGDETPADRWRRAVVLRADAEGRLRVPTETEGACGVVVVHGSGVRDLRFSEFQAAPEIRLQAWGTVEGRVLWHDRPGAGEQIMLSVSRDDGYPGLIDVNEETQTDAAGAFRLEKVMPGPVQISRPITLGGAARADGVKQVVVEGMYAHVEVAAGKPTPVILGGQGRTIRARLTGQNSWDGVRVHFHPSAPPFHGIADDPAWKAVSQLQASPIGPLYFRELAPDAQGKLEISNVLPGRYQLIVFGAKGTVGSTTAAVPLEEAGAAPAALDVGDVAVGPSGR